MPNRVTPSEFDEGRIEPGLPEGAPRASVQQADFDPNSPEFAAEARRQARAVANSPLEPEDQAFIDAISELKF